MESTERKNFYNDKNYISFVVAYDGNIKKEIGSVTVLMSLCICFGKCQWRSYFLSALDLSANEKAV